MRFFPVAAVVLLASSFSPVSFAGAPPGRVPAPPPETGRTISPVFLLEATGARTAPRTFRAGGTLWITGPGSARRFRVQGTLTAESSWGIRRTVIPRENLSLVGTREIPRTVVPVEFLSARGCRIPLRTVSPAAKLEMRGTERETRLILPGAAFNVHGTLEHEAAPLPPGRFPFHHPPIPEPQ